MQITHTDYAQAIAVLRAEFAASPGQALPPSVRAAALFAWTLRELPLGLMPGESLAGDYGMIFADAGFRRRAASVPGAQAGPPPSAGAFRAPIVRVRLPGRVRGGAQLRQLSARPGKGA